MERAWLIDVYGTLLDIDIGAIHLVRSGPTSEPEPAIPTVAGFDAVAI